MRLPKDNGDWHDGHLAIAVAERDNAFARYESRVDFTHPETSAEFYAELLRKEQIVENILNVIGRPTRGI